jgi:NTP pyrophosphatase (non-canonical NTP hydrolase)
MVIDDEILLLLHIATEEHGSIIELAEEVGVTRETVHHWLSGKTKSIREEDWAKLKPVLQKRLLGANIPQLSELRKGWWDEPNSNGKNFMLMVSELAEAMEADRYGNPPSNKIPSFLGIEEELADVIIRILDFAEYHDFDVIEAMRAKVVYNRTREYKHGGKKY